MKKQFSFGFAISLLLVISDAFWHAPERRAPLRYRSPVKNLTVGQDCDSKDSWWYPVPEQPHKFAFCHKEIRKIVTDVCATVNGIQKFFDEAYQQCVMPSAGAHKAPGLPRSSRFGEACVYNTDCLNNMYCPAGTCLCLVGFIDVGSDCYTVINPGQNGCISRRQCEAVWPGSDCDDGVCKCPKPKTAVETRDGFVCVAPGTCPLPEDVDTNVTLTSSPPQLSTVVDTTKPQCKINSAAATDAEGCFDSGASQSLTDLYDCIPTSADGTDGLCCPNRALTCMLSKKTSSSPGSKGVTRYWYNSVTGTCEQFLWDPAYAESTANNFRTVEQCRSYCQTSCRRGAPEYNGNSNSAKTKACTTNGECTRSGNSVTFQCTTVGARQFCCPSTDWICSATGGRDYKPVQTPDGGAQTSTKTTVVRWYYEATAATCRSFPYKGEGGNFNNFHTMDECSSFCARSLCERGDPLKDASGNNQQCSGSRGCPSTYECRQNVCCPRKQTVCIQPKMVGTCTSAISRYWYNAATRDCEQFVYTGCNGNDNNFESYLSCQNYCRDAKPEPKCIQGEADKDASGNHYTCSLNAAGASTCRLNYECYFDGYMFGCCPTKAWTCSLNKQIGTSCVASTVRWYFDSTSKSCQTFTYSGCDGNSNNFQTRQQCEQYCGVGGCPFGGEPYQDPNTMQRKVCNGNSAPCPSGYECTMVTVSGSPINYCCPTRAFICGQSPNQGTQCGSTLQRYYLNIATKVCTTFTYFGCGGNENNFATLSQCNNFCSSVACAPGESVYLDPNSQKPITCNIGLQNGCPSAYACKMDSLTNKYLCCGSTDMGLCPVGERAYIEALTQSARECQPGVAGSCPTSYLCRPNQVKNRYYCCSPDSKAVCPAGKAPFRDPVTQQPQTCYINTLSKSCPTGYVCQTTSSGVQQGFCCSAAGLCPRNNEYYVESATGNPRQCVVSSSSDFSQCPTGYSCMLGSSAKRGTTAGYCCKLPPPPASVACTGGQQAVLQNGVVRSCTPSQPCPNESVCTPYTGNGQSYCCKQPAVNSNSGREPAAPGSDGCPPGTSALVVENLPRTCDLTNAQSCPVGYSCQYSQTEQTYRCCGSAAVATTTRPLIPAVPEKPFTSNNFNDDGCPTGQVAAKNALTNMVQTCVLGNSGDCPVGFSCQYSAAFGRSQCCGLNAGCPKKSVAFIDAASGRPQYCDGINSCPPSFSCQTTAVGDSVCCSSSQATSAPYAPAATIAAPMDSACPAGQPLDKPHSCSDSTPCPTAYECLPSALRGAVCCPTKQNVCTMMLDSGSAHCQNGTPSQRYFYSVHSGSCQPFTYSGCGGNNNNFANIMDCDSFCAKGVCKRGEPARSGSFFRFCRPGSDDVCPVGYECSSPLYGPAESPICCPSKASVCASVADTGASCSGGITGLVSRYYYDSRLNACKKFDYRGCGGNGNNFITSDECHSYCGRAVQTIVPKPAHTGSTDSKETSSRNNFSCLSSNSKPFLTPGDSTPFKCQPNSRGESETCPIGYVCQFSGVESIYICCSSPSPGSSTITTQPPFARGFCPRNHHYAIDTRTRAPQICTSYVQCPSNHRCLFSPIRRRGFCCRRANETMYTSPAGSGEIEVPTNACPQGQTPFIAVRTQAPMFCALGRNSMSETCPAGYSCAYSSMYRGYICCGGRKIGTGADLAIAPPRVMSAMTGDKDNGGCRRGRAFFYPGTRSPLACPGRGVGANRCPRGYVCDYSAQNARYQCCSSSWASSGSSENNVSMDLNLTSFGVPESKIQTTTAGNLIRGLERTTPPTESSLEHDESEYIDLLPSGPSDPYMLRQLISHTIRASPIDTICDVSEQKRLGDECCADEQCNYGCRYHHNKKLCLCQSNLILDMTQEPFRCSPTCSAWRDGGTCVSHALYYADDAGELSKENSQMKIVSGG